MDTINSATLRNIVPLFHWHYVFFFRIEEVGNNFDALRLERQDFTPFNHF
jgi:hypothetical protein